MRSKDLCLPCAVMAGVVLMLYLHFAFVRRKPIRLRSMDFKSLVLACPNASSENVVEMQYGDGFDFLLSLHPSDQDGVVSKGIKEGLFGPMNRYPSIDEMQAICRFNNTASCAANKVFVEVGSALGMVSVYMASRGMKVYAYDPLLPNIERLSESRCLNRQQLCSVTNCSEDDWRFSRDMFRVFWNAVGAADALGKSVQIESEPGNLAATMRGGGDVRVNVPIVTVDRTVDEEEIEIMLLTCQGQELSALLGASGFVKSRRIRNIVWRVHSSHREAALKVADLLQSAGYRFYTLEAARSSGGEPVAMSYNEILAYVDVICSHGGHPNILATLGRNDSEKV